MFVPSILFCWRVCKSWELAGDLPELWEFLEWRKGFSETCMRIERVEKGPVRIERSKGPVYLTNFSVKYFAFSVRGIGYGYGNYGKFGF